MPEHAETGGGVDLATRPRFSFAIGRVHGTVVVTLRGQVEGIGVETLSVVLRDLIDNQGNWVVVVDLREASGVDSSALELFSAASGWARGHGATFRVQDPWAIAADALDMSGPGRHIDP